MSLFNNSNKSRKLESGHQQIKAGRTMSRKDILSRSSSASSSKTKSKEPRATTTFDVTVKIDNHTRNKIMALKGIGETSTIKNFIKSCADQKVNSLNGNKLSNFNKYKMALEHRDYYSSKLHK